MRKSETYWTSLVFLSDRLLLVISIGLDLDKYWGISMYSQFSIESRRYLFTTRSAWRWHIRGEDSGVSLCGSMVRGKEGDGEKMSAVFMYNFEINKEGGRQ